MRAARGARDTLVAMTEGADASPDGRARTRPRAALDGLAGGDAAWPCSLCGGLFAVSALNSGGTDLRPGRYTDLAALVRTESRQYDALRDRVARLTDEVAALTGSVDNDQVEQLRAQARALEGPAGLVEQTGPGVTVVLTDAPAEIAESSQQDPNRLVVHQQDIQAVVNAMWKGGATAVTIQGQRVVSTTGIKCIGNSVQLQGVPYSQPYTISAIGDPAALAAAIAERRLPPALPQRLRRARHRRRLAGRRRDRDHRPGVRRPARHHLRPAAETTAERGLDPSDPATTHAARPDAHGVGGTCGSAGVSVGSTVGVSLGVGVGVSVGSSNVETTIVTEVPSGCSAAAARGSA